jgi:hypothetical protein
MRGRAPVLTDLSSRAPTVAVTKEVAMRHTILSISAALLIVSITACGGDGSAQSTDTSGATTGTESPPLPQGDEPVTLDPAEFTTEIDNPYWPMKVGSRWVYRETDAEGAVSRVEVTVTDQTKMIMGIESVVVHDIVTEDGEVKEDTLDWYAQDADGNIWYMGEDTKEYENGKVKSTEGSWEAGVDGASAGVIVPADPKPGLTYREEYYKGHAEDAAEILSLNAHADVPYGNFDHALQTRNYTPLEPNLIEEKFYARDVGLVLAFTVSGGSDREVLVSYREG